MKKIFVLLVLTVLVVGLFADDFMKATEYKVAADWDKVMETRKVRNNSVLRDAPPYEFVLDPVGLITNYYDYMPGSYNGTPIQIQPDEFGGVYLTFHARETADATRREYYSYIDAAGNITTGTIGVLESHEGYSGIDIDPDSGDPIVAWHVNSDGSGDLEVVVTYDMYHISSGLWITPFDVITDAIPSPNGTLDEFIWPYVHIGPSPVTDKKRVYVQANNSYSAGDPTENPMIAYADFDVTDLGNTPTLVWTYITIPVFDGWNQANPEWIRPFHSFEASEVDGRIAFFGYNTNDEVYVCYNDNYGEGAWTFESMQADIDTWNPQNQDGSYVYLDENGDPHELYWAPIHSGHMTSIFNNGSNNMLMQINMGLQTRPDAAGSSFYYPYEIFPYVFRYDFTDAAFSFIAADAVVNENAANPNYVWQYDDCYIPWDTDKDGDVDEFNAEGNVLMYNGWPIWFWDNDVAFHECLSKVAVNDEKGWVAHIWHDGLKNKYYNDSGDEDYVDWATISEMFIAISNDGGETWSEPIIMNAKADDENYALALDGMMPTYVYLGNEIEVIEDEWGWGLVHMMFLDDDSFGSFIQGHGANLGGTMRYATMKINFHWIDAINNTVVPSIGQLQQNYPNPFNPTTTIAYNVNNASQVVIDVFNVKGQMVKTLINDHQEAGEHTVVWNGKDNNNVDVSSGIYFYKMRAGDRYTSTKKMILLK